MIQKAVLGLIVIGSAPPAVNPTFDPALINMESAFEAMAVPAPLADIGLTSIGLAAQPSLQIIADADPGRSEERAQELNHIFDKTHVPAHALSAAGETALLRAKEDVRGGLGLKHQPAFRGMQDAEVRITGFKMKKGVPTLSILARKDAYHYSGDPLIEAVAVSADAAWTGEEFAIENVRWLGSAELSGGFDARALSSAGETALLRVKEKVRRGLGLKHQPAFRGMEDAEIRITGFKMKNGVPTLSILARKDAYRYSGDAFLQAVTVSADVGWAGGDYKVENVRWLAGAQDVWK